jgi:hypothetical protein
MPASLKKITMAELACGQQKSRKCGSERAINLALAAFISRPQADAQIGAN